MMFEGDYNQAFQILIDNNTIAPEAKHHLALNAIQSVIREDVHFSTTMTKFCHISSSLPDEGIHSPNTSITNVVNKCRFTSEETGETIKVMFLQHAVKYQEVRD